MLENMRIFIPNMVLIYPYVEMPVGFTNVASQVPQVNLHTSRDLRESRIKPFGLNVLHSLNGEKMTLTFKSLQYLLIIDEILVLA